MDVGITTEKFDNKCQSSQYWPLHKGFYGRSTKVRDIWSVPYWAELDIDLGLGQAKTIFIWTM
jgi:hypothetical protein